MDNLEYNPQRSFVEFKESCKSGDHYFINFDGELRVLESRSAEFHTINLTVEQILKKLDLSQVEALTIRGIQNKSIVILVN